MKNLKKVLALVVALTMVLGTVAFAAYTDVSEEAAEYTAVSTLSSLGILTGYEDGTFKPEGDITRAEFATVVCRALNVKAAGQTATQFTDVPADHWASGFIAYCAGAKIVNGMGDGTFAPDANVTYEQAIKMLVVALGYEPMAAQKGGYPTGYMVVANTNGITDGIAAPAQTAPATRGVVAQLVYNALDVPVMEQTGFGTNTEFTILDGTNNKAYKTLLTALDVAKLEGVVVGTAVYGGDCEADEIVYSFNEANDDEDWEEYLYDNEEDGYAEVTLKVAEGVNADDYFGYASIIYVKEASKGKYEVIAIMPGEDSEVVELGLEDLDADTDDNTIYYYASASSSKTSKYKIAGAIVYSNYEIADSFEALVKDNDGNILEGLDMEITLIENSGDNTFDMIIVKEYAYDIVDTVEADKDRFEAKLEGQFKFDFEDDSVAISITNKDGEEIDLDAFAEGDVIAFISDNGKGKNYTRFIEVINLGANAVTGAIDEVKADAVYVDGTEYLLATTDSVALGDEGTFFLTNTGKIFAMEKDASVSGNYAYILEAGLNSAGFSDLWQVKLLTKNNEIVIYNVRDNFKVDGVSYADDGECAFLEAMDNNFKENVEDRIITYKLDSKNLLREINPVTATAFTDKEYDADAQVLANDLENDTVIFDIKASSMTSAFATDINYLVNEGEYSGYIVENDDEFDCVVITAGESPIDATQDLAIIKSVTDITIDEGTQEAKKVTYYTSADETELSLVVVDDEDVTTLEWGTVLEDLVPGAVFVFAANAEGTATSIAVIATADAEEGWVINETATAAMIEAEEDNDFVYGYIVDTTRATGGTKLTYANDGDEAYITVKSSVNGYTFEKRNASSSRIYVGDWQASKVDVYDEDTAEANFFFARKVRSTVNDIFTYGNRIEIAQ